MLINIFLGVVAVATIVLGLIVYLNRPKDRSSKVFVLFTFSVGLWIAFNLFANLSSNDADALFWSRLTTAAAALIGYSTLLLSLSFPLQARLPRKTLVALGILPLIFIVTAPTSLNVISSSADGSKFVPGQLYSFFSAYFLACLAWSLLNFFRALRRTQGVQRLQTRFVITGIFLSAIPGIFLSAILPLLGVNDFLSIMPAVAFIFVAFVSYAMLKHKLFDIRTLAARALTYVLVIATISVLYGLTAFVLVGGFIFKDSQLSFAQQAFYAMLAVVLAFTFQPIRRFFERITDKIFYRDKYDPQELINAVGRILTAEIRLNVLTKEVTKVIEKQMRVSKVDIVVVNDKNIYYQARVLRADRSELELKDLQELGKPILVADDMTTGERKDIMDKYGLRVSVTLRTSEEFVGYLLLGEKLSGDIYNEQDLAVLRIIANELAVAVQNAKAYTEIQQFNKTLQAKVVAATRKLRKANEDLKELDQAKDEFISMASHQLRTPLTTAKGYVSMVLEGDFGKIQPAMKEPLEQSLDSANRMAGLVSDLLNVSRMEAGRFFIDPTDVDLNTEVPAEIQQLQTLAQSKSVKLVYDKPAKPVPVLKLDLDKTRQVIMNLADNAVHYSAPPNGGGEVHVSLAQEGEAVVFKVVDNGIGVPEAQQKKLFKKFFRAGNAQNTRPDGTGLGLYLVKRVVEDQGGEIIFESKEGKGSTFGFKMPIHNKIRQNSKAAQKLEESQKQAYSPVPGSVTPEKPAESQEKATPKTSAKAEGKKPSAKK